MSEHGGEKEQGTKRRKSGLTTLDLHLLEQACKPVWRAFGSGSGGEYRDVDVRTILPDEEFDALFGAEDRNGKALWSLMCAAIGRMLAKQTGLPIDYQIQRMTQANEKYQGNRNPIGAGRRYYAGGGDATVFPAAPIPSVYAPLPVTEGNET